MATQSLFGQPMVSPLMMNNNSAFTTTGQISAVNNGYGVFFFADDIATHGAITGFYLSVASVTGTPTFTASLQSYSTIGNPSGTILGGASPASVSFTPTVGVSAVSFANSYTPSLGDPLCIVIQYTSGSTGANFNYGLSSTLNGPYPSTQSSSTWTPQSAIPMLCPIYTDGFTGRGFGVAASVLNNVTASTVYGTTWTPAISSVIVGVEVLIKPVSGSNLQAILYEGSSTTIASLTNVSQSGNENFALIESLANARTVIVPMTKYTMTAGTQYRLVIKNSGTAYSIFPSLSFLTQALLQAYWGPLAGTIGTTTTFTDYQSGSDWRSFPVIPIIDSYTASGGGGGVGLSRTQQGFVIQ